MDYRIFKTRFKTRNNDVIDDAIIVFFIRSDILVADDERYMTLIRLADVAISFTRDNARVFKSRAPEIFAQVLGIPIVNGYAFLASLDETVNEQQLLEITLQQDFESNHWIDLTFDWRVWEHIPTQCIGLVQKRIDELIEKQKEVDQTRKSY